MPRWLARCGMGDTFPCTRGRTRTDGRERVRGEPPLLLSGHTPARRHRGPRRLPPPAGRSHRCAPCRFSARPLRRLRVDQTSVASVPTHCSCPAALLPCCWGTRRRARGCASCWWRRCCCCAVCRRRARNCRPPLPPISRASSQSSSSRPNSWRCRATRNFKGSAFRFTVECARSGHLILCASYRHVYRLARGGLPRFVVVSCD